MRPQHITAENSPNSETGNGQRWSGAFEARRFNEAAAYHCGKPGRRAAQDRSDRRFNEAAAYHCGKPGWMRRISISTTWLQ